MTDFSNASHGTPTMDRSPRVTNAVFAGSNESGMLEPGILDTTRYYRDIEDLSKKVYAAESLLRNKFGQQIRIDEAAVLFSSDVAVQDYISRAIMEPRVEHFNASYDKVTTKPIVSWYRARYDFLRVEGEEFRVECMAIVDGVSPLHAAKRGEADRYSVGSAIPIHLSYKVSSESDYEDAMKALAENGFTMAQDCESDYGRFSYWSHPDMPLYIKPRVNLRDAR